MSRLALPETDHNSCTGCGRCVAACPPHVLWLEAEQPNGMGNKHALLHNEPGCTGCAKCVVACPFNAITMIRIGSRP